MADEPTRRAPGGRAHFRFPGGVVLSPPRGGQLDEPIAVMPPPDTVTLPLAQHEGLPAVAIVAAGDKVLRGQMIARSSSAVSASVHASVSGTVRAIGMCPVPHASGLSDECIVIDSDGHDTPVERSQNDADYQLIDPNLLRQEVADAGVVGLGGAVFPTATKLAAAVQSGLSTLVINGAECDPYISCDEMTLREHADDVLRGAQVMMHILQINKTIVAIETDKQEACEAVRSAMTRIDDDRIALTEVPAIYPEGGERQLIQVLSGKEVPSDGLPLDIGYVCHNVGTARAVAAAILRGESLVSRVVTVCGPGIAAPRNVEVRLGTPVSELVEFCGGYQDGATRLVVGGAMMGVALDSDDVPVVKAFNCVLALDAGTARPNEAHLPCIRCADCADVCPASLLPQQLFWYAKSREFERALSFHLFDCIECGCCDLVCPSHIPLAGYFRYAKAQVRDRELAVAHANHARGRFEKRNARLDKEQARRRTRTEERKRAVAASAETDATEDPSLVIQAAVARARAKRAARKDENQNDGGQQ